MKKSIYVLSAVGSCLCILLGGSNAQAAELYSSAPTTEVAAGDTVVIQVYLNTEGKQLNAVEGVVRILGGVARVADTSVGGSVLTVWPRPPSVEPTAGEVKISFTGGVPGGFMQSGGLLFKLVVVAERPGKIIVQPEQIVSYENDGKGTKILTSSSSLALTVTAEQAKNTNTWQQAVAADRQAPDPFDIVLGQNSAVYDNKKFISFNATDSGSGMDYYEVAEGSHAPVRAQSPYVLQDQSLRGDIVVTAYDKAGNERRAVLSYPRTQASWGVYGGVGLAALCILIVVGIFLRRKKKQT